MLTTCYTGRLRFHRRHRFQRHLRHRFRYCDYEKATQERLKSYQAKAKKKDFCITTSLLLYTVHCTHTQNQDLQDASIVHTCGRLIYISVILEIPKYSCKQSLRYKNNVFVMIGMHCCCCFKFWRFSFKACDCMHHEWMMSSRFRFDWLLWYFTCLLTFNTTRLTRSNNSDSVSHEYTVLQ